MQKSFLCLDVYSIIVKNSDWATLIKLLYVNKYINFLAKKELKKRWISDLPLSEAKLLIITQDIYLESIFCCSGTNKVWIDPKEWNKICLRYILNELFSYSPNEQKFKITNKLFHQLIRIINKKIGQGIQPINEHRQTMIFSQQPLEWKLENYY